MIASLFPRSNRLSRLGRGLPRLFALALLLAGTLPAPAAASGPPGDVLELPLEQLMNIPIVSASRKTQAIADVASAVFVITQDDIRHSAATTIPELLRMVPGVQVAQVDGTTWAVSIRGFNGNYANKLLVMIDGRSVYTPLYGGVFWDVQDLLFENIERIEVIRGPGSTMWGANAVNGVINIITKSAHDTYGTLVTALAGDREHRTVSARYGAGTGNGTSYRLYLKNVDRGGTHSTGPAAADSLNLTRGGFRVDAGADGSLNLTVQGDAYGGSADHTFTVPLFSAPFTSNNSSPVDLLGGNFLSRLDWLQSETSKYSLQLYYDRTGRDTLIFNERRDTVDLDLQHNLRINGRHELTWGAGYRFLHDHTPGSAVFALDPTDRSDTLINLFAQDEITLLPETLRLVLGTKVEHRTTTGWQLEPSAKLSFTPRKEYSLWASVTRSVRTPTRAEQDVSATLAVIPPTPPAVRPTFVTLSGNEALQAESLMAYEAGLRAESNAGVSFDLSTFYNRYTDVITPQTGTPFPQGSHVNLPSVFRNVASYDSSGGELAVNWQPLEWWKLKGGYSYIRFFGTGVEASPAVKATPGNQATLRSLMALGKKVDFDLTGRYVGENRFPLANGTVVVIPDYVTMDARLAWRPAAGWEVSLAGRNLLQRRHLETVSDQTAVRHEIERDFYGKVSWAF